MDALKRSGRFHGNLIAVGLFTATYLSIAVAGAFRTGNGEFLFYIGVMFVLIAAVVGVHLRIHFTSGVLWALSVWGLLHMAGGLLPLPESWPIHGDIRVLYSLWIVPGRLKYDHLVHAYGFGVMTWVCWQCLRAAIAGQTNRPREEIRATTGLVVCCAMAAGGFGALNEVVEFAATLLVPETNVGGYENTGWDLVSNFVGAAIAAAYIRFGNAI